MPCILVVLGLFFPRLVIVLLWLFSGWFEVFDGWILPILGFIFLPFSLLWYSVVLNYYGGEWSILSIILMILAVLLDLGAIGGSARGR